MEHINLEERFKWYRNLPTGEKKKTLLTFLEKIKTADPLFQRIIDQIQKDPQVEDLFLIVTYVDLVLFAETLKEQGKEKALGILNGLQAKMKYLHELEEKERQAEDPDSLLDQI